MGDILTIDELAAWLKMTRRQVYELTRARTRETTEHPIPVLRINGNTRFRRQDIERWLEELATEEAA